MPLYEFDVLDDDMKPTGETVDIVIPIPENPKDCLPCGAIITWRGDEGDEEPRLVQKRIPGTQPPLTGPEWPVISFQTGASEVSGTGVTREGYGVFNNAKQIREHCAKTGQSYDWIPGCDNR